jgi:hypothetical protein
MTDWMTDSMTDSLTADQARDALTTIERGRRSVIDEIDMPRWYWWGLAVGWIGLGIVTDLGRPWLTIVATILFGAVHAAVSSSVSGGRRRTRHLRVHAGIAGARAQLAVFAGLVGLAGLTIAGALLARADHAHHPVTIASIVVAVVIVLGGPALMTTIRRAAVRSQLTA